MRVAGIDLKLLSDFVAELGQQKGPAGHHWPGQSFGHRVMVRKPARDYEIAPAIGDAGAATRGLAAPALKYERR